MKNMNPPSNIIEITARPASLTSALHALWDGRPEPAAFMGIDGRRLEMLLIRPEACGQGLGRRDISRCCI